MTPEQNMTPDENHEKPAHNRSGSEDSGGGPLGGDLKRSALGRFLGGLNEFIFHTKLGVADVQMIDYVNDLLLRFVRVEAMHRVRRPSGQPTTDVVQMLGEAEKRIGLAKREVHRHIGDFTLFWSGMYPESLRRSKSSAVDDAFRSYCLQGKRAYQIAARIEGGVDRPSGELLSRMSDQFELCAYGLREVRREWEESSNDGGGLLIS